MVRLPQALLFLSTLPLAAAITALVLEPRLTVPVGIALGSSAGVAALGLLLGTRTVRQRVPPLRTLGMTLAPLHAEGVRLINELGAVPPGTVDDVNGLAGRVADWDGRREKALSRAFGSAAALYEAATIARPGSAGWAAGARVAMNERVSRLAGLMHEARHIS